MRSAMSSAVSCRARSSPPWFPAGWRDHAFHLGTLLARETREGLVQQQHARLLRERHGDLDAALLAVRTWAMGRAAAASRPTRASTARASHRTMPAGAEHAPARARKAEERKRDVVLERVVREERDDLVGAREPGAAAPGREARDVRAEERDAPGVAREIAGERLKSVVLPAPFGPIIRRRSPARPRARRR